MPGPLAGIRVLDLSQLLLGPFATLLLSDLGAEVIKVEKPRIGDVARDSGPLVRGTSLYFLSLNRGKKSITLDLSAPRGAEVFVSLVKKSDVLVENFSVGTMQRLGLDYASLEPLNPRLIYASGTGFGQSGPLAHKPAFDITVEAMGGILSLTGEENGPPVKPGVSLADVSGGLFLCTAILAALHERDISGRGQYIDIAMLDCQVTLEENAFVRFLNTGELPRALGTRHPTNAPFQVFRTADGYIALALKGGEDDQWPLFCALIGSPDLSDDPRFADGWLRAQNYAELAGILERALRSRTTVEWLAELDAAGIACSPVNSIADAAALPQVNERGMVLEVEQPGAGTFKAVNSPFKFSRTQAVYNGLPAPELGKDTEDVLVNQLGLAEEDIRKLRDDGII